MRYCFSSFLLYVYILLLTYSQALIEVTPKCNVSVVLVYEEKEKLEKTENVIDLQELLSEVSTTLKEQKQECKQQELLSEVSTTPKEQKQECKQHCGVCGKLAQDCSDHYRSGERKSGVYKIMLNEWRNINVYCDMDTDEGGWTIIQRRGQFGNPEDYFFRGWTEYRERFGDIEKEFWIGNDDLSSLTTRKAYELRVDLKDMENISAYANYGVFRVENRRNRYKLSMSGFSGTAGDSLNYHNNMIFSTKDKESSSLNCASTYKGAWWYGIGGCHHSNPNGLNLKGTHKTYADGMNWYSWKGHYYSVLFSEMKVRPIDF